MSLLAAFAVGVQGRLVDARRSAVRRASSSSTIVCEDSRDESVSRESMAGAMVPLHEANRGGDENDDLDESLGLQPRASRSALGRSNSTKLGILNAQTFDGSSQRINQK